MGTLIEEILGRRIGRAVQAGEIVLAPVDYIMSHDNTTPLAIKAWRRLGKPLAAREKIVIHFDHAYPAPNLLAAEAQQQILAFMQEEQIENFYKQGVCHQVMIEEGFVTPGRIIIGADSHSNTYGALGAFGTGMGSTDVGVAWATGQTWFRVPETVLVRLEGQTQPGVSAKDVMLYLAGVLGADGATYMALEFGGGYIERLPMPERIVFANMSTEVGAKCGLIAPDEVTEAYLLQETMASGPFERPAVENPLYARVVELEVNGITPQVACHPRVDRVHALEAVAGLPIDEVFIGTCTNGRYEDLEQAAAILRGRRVHPGTRVIVTPASAQIYARAMANGLLQVFLEAGCTIGVVGCGACIGRHGGVLAPGERAFTTMNRNFIGRMGSPEAEIYLGSPASAAATALAGKIADPRTYLEV